MTTARLEFVAELLRNYGTFAHAESQKVDQADAEACSNVAEMIHAGNSAFESLCRLENEWRLRVLDRDVEYSADLEKKIQMMFVVWLRSTDQAERLYASVRQSYESRGYDVAGAELLLNRQREISAALADVDGESFRGEDLDAMADAAIEENRRGETSNLIGG